MRRTLALGIGCLSVVWASFAMAGVHYTNGFRPLVSVALTGATEKVIFLDQACPLGGPVYYQLDSLRVDVDAYYAAAIAALTSGATVKIGWESDGADDTCFVAELEIQAANAN